MGQQQLLLLVLGIVIVGLAVVVGIQAFSENQTKANADAMINDGVRIASDAQAWALKPAQFGGGAGDFYKGAANNEDVTLADLGYTVTAAGTENSDVYQNLNGEYYIEVIEADELLIEGESYTAGDSTRAQNGISVRVCGFEYNDIFTTQGLAADDDPTPAPACP
jgi:hypothetical protein